MAVKKYLVFNGTMTTESDLHVGASPDGDKIGGCDNPILRNKLTGEPFIPGSSLKGVMRFLKETTPAYKDKVSNGEPCSCGQPNCIVCKMFGSHKNKKPNSGLPRLIVSDLTINKKFKERLIASGMSLSDIVDIRTSNKVTRNPAIESRGLRNMEVISAGTVFDCSFKLRVQDTDNETELVNALKSLVTAVEVNSGIGSKLTSGCGKVKFDINYDKPETYTI